MSFAGLYNFLSGQAEKNSYVRTQRQIITVSQGVHSGLAQRMLVWNMDTGTELLPLPLICQHTHRCFWFSYCHLIAIPNYILYSI